MLIQVDTDFFFIVNRLLSEAKTKIYYFVNVTVRYIFFLYKWEQNMTICLLYIINKNMFKKKKKKIIQITVKVIYWYIIPLL
jgi:hypothetical protein